MKTLINIFLTFLFCIGLCNYYPVTAQKKQPPPSSDQVEQPSRYEIELKWDDEFFDVISAEENGIFLIRKNFDLIQRNEMAWQVIVLDTTLNVKWQKDIFLRVSYELSGYDYYRNKIFLLYTIPESYKDDHIILEVDMITGLYQKYEVRRSFNIELTEFEILNNTAIFGGYFNNKPAILQYFFREGKTLTLPGFYEERSRIIDVHVNDEQNILTTLTSIRTKSKVFSMVVRRFLDDGTMIENTTLEPFENTSLIDARYVTINNDIDIIAGTYSNKNYRYSRGIFLAHVDENEEQTLKYYNYGELTNFFNYMKAKKQKRVQERIKRKKIKGKKLRFNYRLLVHDILKHDDEYILVGEAYYPKYGSTYGYYGGYLSNYNPYRTNPGGYSYFEGFKYTHAIVIGFGNQGTLLWDNSFEINDIISYDLKQMIEVDARDDEIVLLYNFENVIRSKLIKDEDVLEGKSFNDINLKFQDDIIDTNNSEFGGLESWYDNKFYAYGVQKIKNLKDAGVKLNRKVFFVNKILYN